MKCPRCKGTGTLPDRPKREWTKDDWKRLYDCLFHPGETDA